MEITNGTKSPFRKVRKRKNSKRKRKQRKNSKNFTNVTIKEIIKRNGGREKKTWTRTHVKVLNDDGSKSKRRRNRP